MLEVIRTVRLSTQVKGDLFVNITFLDGETVMNAKLVDSTAAGFIIIPNGGPMTLCVLTSIKTVEFANV